MRILITGGLGFIGSHLGESLVKDGHELTIIDDLSTGKHEYAPMGATIVVDDVSKPGVFDAVVRDMDAVVHLAAIASVEISHHQWLRTHQVNISGLVNLYDTMVRLKKKIPVVFASSAAVYGGADPAPLCENGPVQPGSAYGADKLSCEYHGHVAANIHQIPTIGLRFFNVYGPKQDPHSLYWGVVSIFAGRVVSGKPLVIHGDGKQSRDFIYVEDIVRGIRLSLDALLAGTMSYGIFNLCTGRATSVLDVADALSRATGKQPALEKGPARAGDARYSLGNPSLAAEKLNFKAEISLEEGLRHTLAWLKDNL